MREGALERSCCRLAAARGCWAVKLWPTVAGLPDRLILLPNGRAWFVEFKAPGAGRVSPQQRAAAARLNRLGYLVTHCDNRAAFGEWLDRLLGPVRQRRASCR